MYAVCSVESEPETALRTAAGTEVGMPLMSEVRRRPDARHTADPLRPLLLVRDVRTCVARGRRGIRLASKCVTPVYDRRMRNPGTAAVFSAIVPGIGQFYNGDFLRGIFWLIVTPGMWIGTGGLLGWICHVIAAFTAYNRAKRKNVAQALFKP